jgi:hypothetical protein
MVNVKRKGAIALLVVAAALTPAISASAATPTKQQQAQQFKKLVAKFNRDLGGQKAPSATTVKSDCVSVESALSSAHWTGATAGDVKLLVADTKAFEPVLVDAAKAAAKGATAYKPTTAQTKVISSFESQDTKVRTDLGLPANATGI